MLRRVHSTTAQLLKLVLIAGVVAGLALGFAALREMSAAQAGDPREKRWNAVGDDETPAVDDVIEAAGAPTAAHRAEDGSMLLTYWVPYLEDDEGNAAHAWRAYGPEGRTVADQAEQVSMESGPPHASLGPVGGFSDAPVSHPSSRWQQSRWATHRSAQAAERTGSPDEVRAPVVDDEGTRWALVTEGDRSRVRWSADGREDTHGIPAHHSGLTVAAAGGTAVVPLTRTEPADEPPESGPVDSLLLTTDGGRTWRVEKGAARTGDDGSGAASGPGDPPLWEFGEEAGSLSLGVLADGRVVIGGKLRSFWIADSPANRSFHEVELPARFTSVQVSGGTLVGIADSSAPRYEPVKGEGLWTSEDGGRAWERFEDGAGD